MVIGRLAPARSQLIGKWCIRGSLVVLTTLVVGSLTSGRLPIAAYGWLPPLALILFGGVIMGLCYAAGFLSGLKLSDSFTVAQLVTVRNGNLGILMKASLFPAVADVVDPIGNGVLYVVLFYSGVSLVLAIAAVVRRRVGVFGVAAAAAATR
jgi:BASS family bile acid:Na+ symporter